MRLKKTMLAACLASAPTQWVQGNGLRICNRLATNSAFTAKIVTWPRAQGWEDGRR